MTKRTLFIAFVVSLGGFLFGFDAGIISRPPMWFENPTFIKIDASELSDSISKH